MNVTDLTYHTRGWGRQDHTAISMKQREKNNASEFNLRPANKTLRGGRDCLFCPKNSADKG